MMDRQAATLTQRLPACAITFFSAHATTREAAAAFKADWRCGGLNIAIEDGSIDTARAIYETKASPDLLIVEVGALPTPDLLTALEALAGVCAEHTAAILIGPHNDVDVYRQLTRMGVLDYLVAPVTAARLMECIGSCVLDRFGIADNVMSLFLGSAGGVGTSTLAGLTARGLADTGRKTALCDLLPGRSPLPVHWNVECTGGLSELGRAFATQDVDSLYRLAPKAHAHMHVFTPAKDTPFDFALSHDEQTALLQGLRTHFPYLVYDTAGFTPKILRGLIPTAPHVFLVTTPDVARLRAARILLSQIRPLRGGEAGHIHVLINHPYDTRAEGLSRKDILSALDCKDAVFIPHDKTMPVCLNDDAYAQGGAQAIQNMILPMMGIEQKPVSAGGKQSWLRRLGLEV